MEVGSLSAAPEESQDLLTQYHGPFRLQRAVPKAYVAASTAVGATVSWIFSMIKKVLPTRGPLDLVVGCFEYEVKNGAGSQRVYAPFRCGKSRLLFVVARLKPDI